MIRVTTDPLDLDACIRAVAAPDCGAIATFLGTVRDHHGDHPVGHLEYEAYVPMAERELGAIADGLVRDFGVRKVAITHRTGPLAIGDVAMAIAISSPHRRAALDALSAAVDRIKDSVPIWKKEVYSDGTDTWLGRDGSLPPVSQTQCP